MRKFFRHISLALLIALSLSSCSQPSAPYLPDGIASQPTVVVRWNEAMLTAVRNGPARPTVIARAMFMVHQAIYDAWTLYHPSAAPTILDAALRRPTDEHTDTNKTVAISYAAYHMLNTLFAPYEGQTQAFRELMNQLGYQPTMVTEDTTPQSIGIKAAQAVLAFRATDGSNQQQNYADTTSATYSTLYTPVNSADPAAPNAAGGTAFNPNQWQPLRIATGKQTDGSGKPLVNANNPESYKDQAFLTPHWGAVRPFALASGDQFRPPAPPQAGSSEPYTDALGRGITHDQAYQMQVDELLAISAALTDEQKVIAEYWADGPRSETPPGHWNALAHGISARDQHTLDDDVKLYFALNSALFDASIAAWDAKRAFNSVRPIPAIRHKYAGQRIEAWGGPNQGTQQILGESWQPYQDPTFVTPAFPEFVSGHSAFSAAAAVVLTRFTGSEQFYDGTTRITEDVDRDDTLDLLGEHRVPVGGNRYERSPSQPITLRWATFQEAADQAGMSRRYGGIHFQDGDLHGRALGQAVGEQAFRLAAWYWIGD